MGLWWWLSVHHISWLMGLIEIPICHIYVCMSPTHIWCYEVMIVNFIELGEATGYRASCAHDMGSTESLVWIKVESWSGWAAHVSITGDVLSTASGDDGRNACTPVLCSPCDLFSSCASWSLITGQREDCVRWVLHIMVTRRGSWENCTCHRPLYEQRVSCTLETETGRVYACLPGGDVNLRLCLVLAVFSAN